MKKSWYTQSQIVVNFKEAEGAIVITEVLRIHGISAETLYKQRSTYGGLEAPELKRVKELKQPAAIVVRIMEQLEEMVGLSKAIYLDNGSELRFDVFTSWCAKKRH